MGALASSKDAVPADPPTTDSVELFDSVDDERAPTWTSKVRFATNEFDWKQLLLNVLETVWEWRKSPLAMNFLPLAVLLVFNIVTGFLPEDAVTVLDEGLRRAKECVELRPRPSTSTAGIETISNWGFPIELAKA